MYVLGFTGSMDLCPAADEQVAVPRLFWPLQYHDAAAVLLKDGQVVAAIEEERLNRTKHTNFFPTRAIGFCLKEAGLRLPDIDHIAWYNTESTLHSELIYLMRRYPRLNAAASPRVLFADICRRALGQSPAHDRIHLVEHHEAHAASAFLPSPFDTALVVTLDGSGDGVSGTVNIGEHGSLRRIASAPLSVSLGGLYTQTIEFLGYRSFDEYKVMGLAPYGNARRFRERFDRICTLSDAGRWEVHHEEIEGLIEVCPPRREDEPVTQSHMDLAASLQEALERAALHHLTYHQQQTGLRNLCLAGGVAHNSVLIGKLVASGLFDSVFVQPAAGDSGCALGAALSITAQFAPRRPRRPLKDLYWGSDIGTTEQVVERLRAWSELIDIVPLTDPAEEAARLLAENEVIGWSQGRSEFGPRALGNRSILADPRPAENKDRINALVKHREPYRPFAPSVLEEHAAAYFEIPEAAQSGFMTTVVPVKACHRDTLGAITHVDGSARIQTVSKTSNPRFWELIDAFRRRTGVPIVLNTSFNHSAEPIVDSVDDIVVCLLTTGLTHVIVGDYLIMRAPSRQGAIEHLRILIPENAQLTHVRQADRSGLVRDFYRCEDFAVPFRSQMLTRAAYEVLSRADGLKSLGELTRSLPNSAEVIKDLRRLWSTRLIALLPPREARQ